MEFMNDEAEADRIIAAKQRVQVCETMHAQLLRSSEVF